VVEQSRALLVIADIGGYTNYMRLHRLSLAHAQANTARLLEAVVDAVPQLELVDIEGDAAFMSTPSAGDETASARAATKAAVAMHRAFHSEQQLIARNMCVCDGCAQAGQLTLKCVAHVGDVARQSIGGRKSLVGVDVILVHRLLKNAVPVPEYVLLSEDLYRGTESPVRDQARAIEEELEGLGPTRAYFIGLEEIVGAVPPVDPVSLPSRVSETLGVLARGMPYLLGFKRTDAAAAE
jgi:Protein of unknown function (DUF2652)